MYLHEYQSKQYFARFGIPTMQGRVASSQQEAHRIAAELGVPVVVNAQALANQRVYRLAGSPEDAEHAAHDILAMTVSGVRVRTILIEPAADPIAEYFLGIYGDRGNTLTLIASTEGGSEISQIEDEAPQTIVRETINPFLGVRDFQSRNLANGINLPREYWHSFTMIVRGLYQCCLAYDAVRAEINPLGLTRGGELVALGGKIIIDDNALFRQPEMEALRDLKAEHESLVQARQAGITYVHLSGNVGCIVSGAGLGMATMDMLARRGASASGLVDLGSDITREKISAALRLILPGAQAVLFNLFADKAPCDHVAYELIAALEDVAPRVPVTIRLAGQNAQESHEILHAAENIHLLTAATTTEAVQQTIAALQRGA